MVSIQASARLTTEVCCWQITLRGLRSKPSHPSRLRRTKRRTTYPLTHDTFDCVLRGTGTTKKIASPKEI